MSAWSFSSRRTAAREPETSATTSEIDARQLDGGSDNGRSLEAALTCFWLCARGVGLLVAGATLVGVFGCSAMSEDLGGETIWLVSCERDDDCAGMDCRCGVCTTECSAPSDCSDLSDATCADGASDASETQCGSSASMGLCLPECTRDSDCSSDQRCVGGGCVLPVRSSSSDNSTDDDSTADDST